MAFLSCVVGVFMCGGQRWDIGRGTRVQTMGSFILLALPKMFLLIQTQRHISLAQSPSVVKCNETIAVDRLSVDIDSIRRVQRRGQPLGITGILSTNSSSFEHKSDQISCRTSVDIKSSPRSYRARTIWTVIGVYHGA